MDKFTKFAFYLLALSPLIGYFADEYLHVFGNWFLGTVYSIISAIYILQRLAFKKRMVIPKYIFLMIALFVYYFLWGLANGEIEKLGIALYLWRSYPLHGILILIYIENAYFDEKFIRNIVRIFEATILAALIVTMIQIFVEPTFFMARYAIEEWTLSRFFEEGRHYPIFTYIGLNEIGFSFLSILSLTYGYQIYQRKSMSFLAVLLGGIIIVFSGGRYLMVGFLIILFQYFLYKERGVVFNRIKLLIAVLLILLCVISIFGEVGLSVENFFFKRVMDTESASTRVLGFKMFAQYFPENPLFGTGQRVTTTLYYALAGRSSQIHITYLSHLFEFGLVGSLFLFAAWALLFRRIWKAAMITKYYGTVFAFIAFFFALATLPEYGLFHYGLLFGVVFAKYFKDNVKATNERARGFRPRGREAMNLQ